MIMEFFGWNPFLLLGSKFFWDQTTRFEGNKLPLVVVHCLDNLTWAKMSFLKNLAPKKLLISLLFIKFRVVNFELLLLGGQQLTCCCCFRSLRLEEGQLFAVVVVPRTTTTTSPTTTTKNGSSPQLSPQQGQQQVTTTTTSLRDQQQQIIY